MSTPTIDQYTAAAARLYGSDELELDEDTRVSIGADDGAWVRAWVWVAESDAEQEEPEA